MLKILANNNVVFQSTFVIGLLLSNSSTHKKEFKLIKLNLFKFFNNRTCYKQDVIIK
jgi:hypothetical protein